MKYKEYEGYTKAYILVHNTGFGVMEAPHKEHEIVYETDDWQDAVNKSEELKKVNNTPEEIESSWYNNSYHINVNTLSEIGKEALKEFHKESDKRLTEMQANPNYRCTTDSMGNKWHEIVDPNSPFYEEEKSDKPLMSHEFLVFNPSKNNMRVLWSTPKNDKDDTKI